MKVKLFKLNALFLASAVATAGAAVPTIAAAGATATVGVANIYLWRGQNLTPDGGQVHGGIEFSNEAGFYGGVWTSSEEGGQETDLYVGYGNEINGFGYDISYWSYQYPEDGTAPNDGMGDNDLAEIILTGSYGPVSVSAYIQTEAFTTTSKEEDSNNYFTVGVDFGAYNLTYGMWDLETPGSGTSGGDEYSHLTLTYAATDEVTLGISKAFSDLDDGAGVEEDPLFYVAYDLSFDLSK